MNYEQRLSKVIPGGAHTYSRGSDQYPANAPQILSSGKGAYVKDPDGLTFLDYGMALRAVNLGYSDERVNNAAIKQINLGNNLTRASEVELEAAELFVDTIPAAEMVKFTKNGSTATTAAIKLARAYTGREMVVRCIDHPFFSYDDWFIGSTVMNKGTLKWDQKNTKAFSYNNIESLEKVFEENKDNIACVILEPATWEHPKDNFLHKVKKLANDNGAVFILDEMITGFRWDVQGAQAYYDIQPDLSTFGKAMANGFSVACVAGKEEIMRLGGINQIGEERFFLLSTTHGAEMCGLGAFIETLNVLKSDNVVQHFWKYGGELINSMNTLADEYELSDCFKAFGIECSPQYATLDKEGKNCLGLRTLFSQEMIKNGVLMPWIALSYAHQDEELKSTEKALRKTFEVLRKAYKDGYEKYLIGEKIKPVFRKYN